MTSNFSGFSGCVHLLHGGDYNPEQWMDMPYIWDGEMRLLRLTPCNTVSPGIFA
jgi:beta-galactosidase